MSEPGRPLGVRIPGESGASPYIPTLSPPPDEPDELIVVDEEEGIVDADIKPYDGSGGDAGERLRYCC